MGRSSSQVTAHKIPPNAPWRRGDTSTLVLPMAKIWTVSYTHALPSPAVVAAVVSAAGALEALAPRLARQEVRIEGAGPAGSGARVRLSFEAAGASFLVDRRGAKVQTDEQLRDLVRQAFEGARRLLWERRERSRPAEPAWRPAA